MPIVWDWDYIVRAFEGMYEQLKDAENQISQDFAHHATGMLKIIPQIRDFEENKNVELYLSLGALVCQSKVKKAKMRIAYGRDSNYVIFTYDNQNIESKRGEFSSEHIVEAFHEYLKEITF